jgi:5-methyltetrahydrofolate--homocysteine methyltransferase
MFDAKFMIDALVEGDEGKLAELVRAALERGVSARQILNEGLMSGMDIVGEKMENEDMFIPEVLRSARAMSNVMQVLTPLLAEGDVSIVGKVVIGTVKGDLHDIGKNLVAMMLESAGFEVWNLGVDISPEKFIAEIEAREANLLCMSALLTTTMPMMKKTIEAIAAGGLRDRVKILIGGAPLTLKFADDIGADGYAPDAGSAVKAAKALLR